MFLKLAVGFALFNQFFQFFGACLLQPLESAARADMEHDINTYYWYRMLCFQAWQIVGRGSNIALGAAIYFDGLASLQEERKKMLKRVCILFLIAQIMGYGLYALTYYHAYLLEAGLIQFKDRPTLTMIVQAIDWLFIRPMSILFFMAFFASIRSSRGRSRAAEHEGREEAFA